MSKIQDFMYFWPIFDLFSERHFRLEEGEREE